MVTWDDQGAMFPQAELAMAQMAEERYETLNSYQLELDFSVTFQDDMPLDGLTKDHFKLRSFATTPFDYCTDPPTFELEARSNGQYTVRVGFRHAIRPTSVSVSVTELDGTPSRNLAPANFQLSGDGRNAYWATEIAPGRYQLVMAFDELDGPFRSPQLRTLTVSHTPLTYTYTEETK